MVERWGPDFHQKCLMTGGSAGTIFALAVALGKPPSFTNELYSNVAVKTLRYTPIWFGSHYLGKEINKMLSDPMAYKKIEGKCCFGTTAFFAKHRWHVSWESNEDLKSCLQASYHIPMYCKFSGPIKGVECVDGAYGFAGVDLPHGDQTLYVGIDPHAEITRTLTHNEMFYPTTGKDYDAMVQSGYDEFMRWNGKMNKKVGYRQPNYSALYVLWTLKVFEKFVYSLFDLVNFILVFLVKLVTKVLEAVGMIVTF
jgi:hypothetical protein